MSDKDYIRLWKAEVIRALPSYSSEGWTQRDLERLAELITEKSGVTISLSTLKRIWKDQFVKLPHPTTLDALVSVLGYDKWHSFVAQHPGKEEGPNQKIPSKKWLIPAGVLTLVTVIIVIQSLSLTSKDAPVRIKGPVAFGSDKTLASGVPNTVMFNFDLQHVVADSFSIQQSWNDRIRTTITAEDNYYASVYYTPGFHRAKLIANDSIIATTRIHLVTDDWFPYMRWDYGNPMPIYLDKTIDKGMLAISLQDARSKLLDKEENHTFIISKFQEFEGVSSDDFTIRARLRTRELQEVACPWLEIRLVTEEHIFYVPLSSPGCVGELKIKLGEEVHYGQTHNLSALGANVLEWQDLSLKVRDKEANVLLNGEEVYQVTFSEDFGDIMGITFRFSGPGQVDEVMLSDPRGIVYHDDFKDQSQIAGRSNEP